jgi:chemotaxis signal transduction protein
MTTPVVVFPIGADRYAVATSEVHEVVADPRPTKLPTAPAVLLGVFNLRGAVIPIFDTAALLGVGKITDPQVALVVATTAGPAALTADGLPSHLELDSEAGPSQLRGTLGVYNVDDTVVVLLDVEALLMGQRSGPEMGATAGAVTLS